MKKIFFILVFLVSITGLRAQTSADSLQSGVDADPRLKVLVGKHVDVNAKGKQKGYRVQIYFGADKAKANDVKSKFLAAHADEAHAYEIYDAPNFKIHVGDFRTRIEAYRFLRQIRGEFPSAFIVESGIENPSAQ